jgi:flagellum-specific ATP synthase
MRIIEAFESLDHQIEDLNILKIYGKVSAVKGIIIECSGLADFIAIGAKCLIEKKVSLEQDSHKQSNELMCEVVGFKDQTVILMPFGDTDGISVGSMVEICDHENYIKPDSSWMGRVINAFGDPIDGLMPLKKGPLPYFLKKTPTNSQNRNTLGPKIELGIKSIDLFTTCCLGQRMGIFAGSGVGKSVLISMLTKFSNFDVKVIGLIGERSREVKEFIDEYLGKEGLKNTVIIVATGELPDLLWLKEKLDLL